MSHSSTARVQNQVGTPGPHSDPLKMAEGVAEWREIQAPGDTVILTDPTHKGPGPPPKPPAGPLPQPQPLPMPPPNPPPGPPP